MRFRVVLAGGGGEARGGGEVVGGWRCRCDAGVRGGGGRH